MPDPDFKTISSSEIPDLLNLSPWGTRLTLWHAFKNREPFDKKQNVRMKIGKVFEAMILEMTAEALALEVIPNAGPEYLRHGIYPLGCTRDASVLCPTRGHGTIEAKAIDKYAWKAEWTDTAAPAMYEVQLQQQMLVKEDTWGAIACFIYNDGADGRLIVYERRPNQEAQARIVSEAEAFFISLAENKPPPAFGLPVEMSCLNDMNPEVTPGKTIDATDNIPMAEDARMYRWAKTQEASFKRIAEDLRPKLLQFMADAETATLATGIRVKSGKSPVAGKVIMLPANIRTALRDILEAGRCDPSAIPTIQAALDWAAILKQPSLMNRLEVFDPEFEQALPETSSNLEAG